MWRAVLLTWWLFGTLALCCPPDCRCFTDDDGYKVANCSRSGLLSGGLFPTIDVLNFKNQLRGSQTKLEARIFRNFRGLQILNLRNSSISHLPNDVFLGIGRVVTIDLSFNKIKHLNGVVFKPLQNLKTLYLRGNSLSMSPLEVIVSDTLEHLDMGYCNINNLPLHAFSSVPNLRHLILDGNSIQTIEYNVLPKGLTYINLAYNHIVEPPINVFNSLRYLFRLDISHNPVNCSCALLAFQDSLSGRAGLLENGVTCANPPHLTGRSINSVNENQLCRDDYAKKSSNSLHSRRSRYHPYDIQSDEPLMRDAEVMFTNDETNQMGTHMESRMGSWAENHETSNQLETMDETTSPSRDDTSPADQSQELVDETPSEEVESQTSPEDHHSTNDSPAPDDLHTEESYSGNDNIINLSSSDPPGGDHSNTLHALGGYNNVTAQSQSTEPQWTDAELLANTTQGDEPSSNLEFAYDDTTTESTPKIYTLPTSGTEAPDYSYDSQHDDYGTADNVTGYDDTSPVLPGSSSTVNTNDWEGSGEPETENTSEQSPSSSTVGFMEERETDTEPSLRTVSDNLEDVSSTTDYEGLMSSSTDSSSTEPSVEPSSSESSSTEPSTYSSSSEASTESSSSEPSTEPPTETSSTEPSTEPSSSEPSTEPSSPEPSTEPSSPEPSTEPSSTEPSTEPSSPEPSTEPSSTEFPIEPEITDTSASSTDRSSTPEETENTETSTETSTELPIEISSQAWTEISSTSEPSSSSEASRGFWWDSDEEASPSSSAATPSSTSDAISTYRKSKMIEFTTESTKNNEIEVFEDIKEGAKNGKISSSPSETSEQNYLASGVTFILIGVLVAIVMILLTIIVCRKKKTKKVRLPTDAEAANGTELQDMLLPKPPENGIKVTPKPYTNGSTVSNGRPKDVEEKEESVPVLAPEPEPEPTWDDKPEPIEAVTARLTMLARPQTPIFIQKSLT